MSVAIRALDKRDVDPPYMTKLAKIATAEMVTSKVQMKLNVLFLQVFLLEGSC